MITEKDYNELRQKLADHAGEPLYLLAEWWGVSDVTLSYVWKSTNYADFRGKMDKRSEMVKSRYWEQKGTKAMLESRGVKGTPIDTEEYKTIVYMLKTVGKNCSEVARLMNRSYATINRIKQSDSYEDFREKMMLRARHKKNKAVEHSPQMGMEEVAEKQAQSVDTDCIQDGNKTDTQASTDKAAANSENATIIMLLTEILVEMKQLNGKW